MEKETLIRLTSDLYKLTLLFPKKEPLRYKIRELADDILTSYIAKRSFDIPAAIKLGSKDNQDLLLDLETLDGFFTIAREQNWVSFSEVLKVSERYVSLRKELEDIIDSHQQVMALETITAETGASFTSFNDSSKSDQRRSMILEILKEKGKAQVWEFKKIFPELSKRTLRRDFEKLLGQGLVERIGERNQTYYQLKPVSETVII